VVASGSKILISEDNYTHSVLLKHMLVTEFNIRVSNIHFATDGLETLKLLDESITTKLNE
jgi:hypothetical protein